MPHLQGLSLILLWIGASKAQVCSTPSWGYTEENGPNSPCWAVGLCQPGLGQAQSPIDIPYYHALRREDNWLPFQFINYHETAENWEMVNTGQGAVVKAGREDCKGFPRFFQGGLEHTYQLNQIYIKWGSWHDRGSEHTIHGKRYSAELQMLHVNANCGREISEGLNCDPPGPYDFAMLSVLVDVGDKHNEDFDPIISALGHVKQQGEMTTIHPIRPIDLLPTNTDKFFRYEGSFTTPDLLDYPGIDCSENVAWTVFKEPLKISYSQLKRMWKLRTDTGLEPDSPLINNFRPNQTLNGREVIYADLELECRHEDWKWDHYCDISYKEVGKEMNFVDAAQACLSRDENTPLVGLMPVSKLRCLRNTYEYSPVSARPLETDICGRFFRVNAIKNSVGEWQEYANGNAINFHHFPSFNPMHGKEGDTLVWDAFENRLIIASHKIKHQPLCYREFQKSCRNCVGHNVGHECGDAGDCSENTCHCDQGFTGKGCQLGPLPDKDVIQVGGAGANRWDSQALNVPGCGIEPFQSVSPAAFSEMICEFVFGRGVCCGGLRENDGKAQNICGFYNCQVDRWEIIHDLPAHLYYGASTVLTKKGEDYGLMISGGEVEDGAGFRSKRSVYLLTKHWKWDELNTVIPRDRSYHCMVQINDCEVALIGGLEDTLNSVSTIDTIDIYNFEENVWRQGPSLAESIIDPACGIVRDRIYFDDKVVIGCGANTANVQIWSLDSDEIYLSAETCPTLDNGTPTSAKFKKLDDQMLILTNVFDGSLATFTAEYGFESVLSSQQFNAYQGDSFVANSGYAACMAHGALLS